MNDLADVLNHHTKPEIDWMICPAKIFTYEIYYFYRINENLKFNTDSEQSYVHELTCCSQLKYSFMYVPDQANE